MTIDEAAASISARVIYDARAYDRAASAAFGTAPVHLVGEEDDQNACGLPGPNALYWRKVTCRDCLDLIEAAESKRLAAGQEGHRDA